MIFLFRGERNYLQGSDFLIYVEKFLKEKKFDSLNLICKDFINTKPIINSSFHTKGKELTPKNYSVLCVIETKNKKICIKFRNSKKKIKNHFPYDDKLFYDNFRVSKKNAYCNFLTTFTDIEILIALTKFWHEKKFKKKGKWIFNRLKLLKPFKNKKNKNFKIKNIYNKFNKYTVSTIIQNKKKIGEIYL